MMAAGETLQPERSEPAFKWLLLCLALAWILAAVMATVSADNAHPDELFHVAAGHYYLMQWLPPRVTETVLLPSISPYGFTYLGEIDATYFLAGKLASLLPGTLLNEHLRFRVFNLLLFFVLVVVYAVRRDPFSASVLMLLTPQIWYVLSYFNNDGFPLFLSLLLVNAAFGSRARGAIAGSESWSASALMPLVSTGILVGLLVLTKPNYLPVIAFVVFFALWRAVGFATAAIGVASAGIYLAWARSFVSMPTYALWACMAIGAALILMLVATRLLRSQTSRTLMVRGAIVALAALAVAAPPLVLDRMINGSRSEKALALAAIAEKHAEPAYRPSESSSAESFFGLRLRDKGLALHEILLPPWDWAVKSWKSFTGYYGYMKIHGPAAYYIAMFALYVFLLSYTTRAILLHGEPVERQLLAVSGVFCSGVILLSLYHSWINDFQAQGRYLFPVVALFAIPFTRASRLFRTRIVPSLLGIAFVLSAFSFLFVGLRKISKGFGP
jgi:hypothetical protein